MSTSVSPQQPNLGSLLAANDGALTAANDVFAEAVRFASSRAEAQAKFFADACRSLPDLFQQQASFLADSITAFSNEGRALFAAAQSAFPRKSPEEG